MNAWRKMLRELLENAGAPRPPALRRSGAEEYLYASDLPELLSPEKLNLFLKKAAEASWRGSVEKGWLLLTRDTEEPPEGWFPGPFGREAACCLSLLERRGSGSERDPAAERMLILSGEEGPEAYEKACAEIHRAWAARLRRKENLPDIDPVYFGKNKKTAQTP